MAIAQLIVVKDGYVVATHHPSQDEEIADLYPGCEIAPWTGAKVQPCDEAGNRTPDPRTA